MPVSAGVESQYLVRTGITLTQMPAQFPCLTRADIPKCLHLLPVQCMTPALKELLSVLSEDIGDFGPMLGHF
jgi:hypothetical protein